MSLDLPPNRRLLFQDSRFFLGTIFLVFFIITSFLVSQKFLSELNRTTFPLREDELKKESLSFQKLFLDPATFPSFEPPEFCLIEKNSLRAITPPNLLSLQVLGVLTEKEPQTKEIKEYTIQRGDTLSSLAKRFGVSLETILWANNLNKNSIIKPGQKLIVPPVSGVIHYVKEGDTLSGIAKTYKAEVEKIISFNNLPNENIYIGDILVIPDGVMPSTFGQSEIFSNLPLAQNQLILPVSSPYIITQGLHWYNAVDFSHPGYACGKPVFAAAGGQVQRLGYNKVYGNYIRILHPNKIVTLYAHLSAIAVKKGDKVRVGEIIGYIGNSGRTRGLSGCHLHFEVRGAKNPFVP